jgi:hypothetical protein
MPRAANACASTKAALAAGNPRDPAFAKTRAEPTASQGRIACKHEQESDDLQSAGEIAAWPLLRSPCDVAALAGADVESSDRSSALAENARRVPRSALSGPVRSAAGRAGRRPGAAESGRRMCSSTRMRVTTQGPGPRAPEPVRVRPAVDLRLEAAHAARLGGPRAGAPLPAADSPARAPAPAPRASPWEAARLAWPVVLSGRRRSHTRTLTRQAPDLHSRDPRPTGPSPDRRGPTVCLPDGRHRPHADETPAVPHRAIKGRGCFRTGRRAKRPPCQATARAAKERRSAAAVARNRERAERSLSAGVL